MNITTFVHTGISARLFAGITLLSLLLSAFPVAFFVAEAAAAIYGPTNQDLIGVETFNSGTIDASNYENLVFSFEYDAKKLDADPQDSFTYGWRDVAGDNDLGTVNGLTGDDPAEKSIVSVSLPAAAQVADLEVYFNLNADTDSDSDKLKLKQVAVSGDEKVVVDTKVDICHWHQNSYNAQNVSINSIVGAHGLDTEDIIPVIPNLYPNGQNLTTDFNGVTGAVVLAADCVVPAVVPPVYGCVDAAATNYDELATVDDGSCEYAPVPMVTLQTAKIVCDYETELPNWGDGTHDISATTATDWLAANTDTSCRLQEGWEFEWGTESAQFKDGKFVGPAGAGWTTFTGSVVLPASTFVNTNLKVREVLLDDYIHFGTSNPYGVAKDISAELYCHTDGLNYDNAERINKPKADEAFYCVAWNVSTLPVEPKVCHLPYLVTFTDDSDETTYNTTAGTGFVIEEIADGYTIGLYDDGRSGVYNVSGTITFPVGTDTSNFVFTEPGGFEGLEQTNILYPDTADLSGNTIVFDLYVNGANDIFTITSDSLESEENCAVEAPVPVEEPVYGPYCGDGVVNQLWEQCDGSDVLAGESCTDYCTLDNQCTDLQLVKVTLDDTDSVSFDGSIHLDMAGNTIPNGTWFNFAESVGAETYASIATAVEGLAVKRDTTNNKLALAFVGGNSSTKVDIVAGSIMTMGIDLGAIDRSPNPQFKLEDGSGSSFEDVFDKVGEIINFDLRADTGNDGVTVEIGVGEEYNCPACQATVEARIVLNDSGVAGTGDLSGEIILGDDTYTTVSFGEWFPISLAANPGDSAVMITDPNTVTNFASPATKPGLFVSRENGTVKVALYGDHAPGGNTNYEWVDGRIEVRDATITDFSTLSGDFKFENHPENNGVPSNDGFDEAVVDAAGVDFKMWVGTEADGFRFTVNTNDIAACVDDTVDPEPVAATLVITNPATPGMTLAGVYDFTADYNDDDEIVDAIQWAIRAGTCAAGVSTVAGNVDGFNDASTFTAPLFSTTIDMSTWTNGDYCFIVNPSEQSGEPNLRATQSFILDNPTDPEPDMFRLSGFKFEVAEGNIPKSGWTVYASNGVDTPLSTVTDINGAYYFDVPAGEWVVAEEIRDNWTQTLVTQDGEVVATDADIETCEFILPMYFTEASEELYFAQTISIESAEPEYECNFYNQYTEPVVTPVTTRSYSSGTRTGLRSAAPAPLVLGASTDQCPFLVDHMQMGWSNDPIEVMKLQLFLNIFRGLFGGTENPVTGTFGAITDANVKAFQETFRADILDPWYTLGIVPHSRPTGFVYKTTLWKINSIVCPDTAVPPSFDGESLQSNVAISAPAVTD